MRHLVHVTTWPYAHARVLDLTYLDDSQAANQLSDAVWQRFGVRNACRLGLSWSTWLTGQPSEA